MMGHNWREKNYSSERDQNMESESQMRPLLAPPEWCENNLEPREQRPFKSKLSMLALFYFQTKTEQIASVVYISPALQAFLKFPI